MKNVLLCVTATMVLCGVGCATPPPVSTPVIPPVAKVVPVQEQKPIVEKKPDDSTPSVPLTISVANSEAPVDGTPFKVDVGQSFIATETCAAAPSYKHRYTLQSIQIQKGKWKMTFEEYAPFDIKINVFGWDDEASIARKKEFLKTQPKRTTVVLTQDEPVNYGAMTGAIYAVNGAFIPVVVSKNFVIFRFNGLSC